MRGVTTGIAAIALYGVGMALLVTGLTVTLALANTALLGLLRSGMAWFEYVSGVFVLLTGVYLTWYWYSNLTEKFDGKVINTAESWQSRLQNWINVNESTVVVVAIVVITAAVILSVRLKRSATPS